MGLGTILLALIFHFRGTLSRKKKSLTWVIYCAILPYVAVITGWITAETGRQPWVIYPVDSMGYPGLSTADALTKNLEPGYVWFSIIAYLAVYAVCTIVFLRFLPAIVKKGHRSPTRRPRQGRGVTHGLFQQYPSLADLLVRCDRRGDLPFPLA